MPTIQVGQTGTLQFTPSAAGIAPADVTDIKWAEQGSPQQVKFTQPDQVTGVAPGQGLFTCTVNCGPSNKMVYKFTVDCVAAVAQGPPPMVPVTIFIPPPSPPAP